VRRLLAGSLTQITNYAATTDASGAGTQDVRACLMSPTSDVLVYQLVTENGVIYKPLRHAGDQG